MKYTNATLPDDHGVIHIVTNQLPGLWGSACDDGSRRYSINRPAHRHGYDRGIAPTCLRCITEDARWWRENH